MKSRISRISEEIKKELATIIGNLKDPRIPMMTSIVRAEVTPDLKYAKAYVSVLADEESQKKALDALKSAEGFIRHELAQAIEIRYIPEITFVLDKSIEHGTHIDNILRGLKKDES